MINLIHIAHLRTLANSLGVDQVRFDRDALVLRFDPHYAVDPVKLYMALAQVGSKMSLQAGKRTSLFIRMRDLSQEEALTKGIEQLEKLIALMQEEPAA